jgi:hypothetical protein
MAIDTRNGGFGQNEMRLRAGNGIDDLMVAKAIVAATGTTLSPQAVMVAT